MGFETQERDNGYERVAIHEHLPAANIMSGETYIVENTTGSWALFSKKKAGLYRSNGSSWVYQGIEVPQAAGTDITSPLSEEDIRRFTPANIASIAGIYANTAITGRVQWMPNPTTSGTTLVPGHTYVMKEDINQNGYYKLGSGSGHIHIIGNNYEIMSYTSRMFDFSAGEDGRTVSIHLDGLRLVTASSVCIFAGNTDQEVNMRLTNCHIEADAQPLYLQCTANFIAEGTFFHTRSASQGTVPAVRLDGGTSGRSKFTFIGCSFYQLGYQHVIEVQNNDIAGLAFIDCSFRKTSRANNYYFIRFINYHQTFVNSTYASFKVCGGQFFDDGGTTFNTITSVFASSYWRTTCQISGIKYRTATASHGMAFSGYYTNGTSGTYPIYVTGTDSSFT